MFRDMRSQPGLGELALEYHLASLDPNGFHAGKRHHYSNLEAEFSQPSCPINSLVSRPLIFNARTLYSDSREYLTFRGSNLHFLQYCRLS